MAEEHKYKPNAKLHLYETKHSGFYPEDPDKLVNLVPKSWTKFTVTDGEWMTDNTLVPLENRDIYLANKIDELDEYKKNYYQASSHFIIDHENKTMSVNPFDTLYVFKDGILYDNENFTVYSKTPAKYGGVVNKLTSDSEGIAYMYTPIPADQQEKYTSAIPGEGDWHLPEFKFSATINGLEEQAMIDEYHRYFDNADIVCVNATDNDLKYDNTITSGEWHGSESDYWDEQAKERKTGPVPGYNDEGTSKWGNTAQYNEGEKGSAFCFDPHNRTHVSIGDYFAAGPNLISGESMNPIIDMVPINKLILW